MSPKKDYRNGVPREKLDADSAPHCWRCGRARVGNMEGMEDGWLRRKNFAFEMDSFSFVWACPDCHTQDVSDE